LSNTDRILNLMKKKNKPLTAYEILDDLSSEGITAPTTIYRALNKLVSKGLIHKIESLNSWMICCGFHKNKIPIFEICKNCGDVKEHLDKKLTESIETLTNRTGFLPDNPIFEIHGQCEQCSLNITNN